MHHDGPSYGNAPIAAISVALAFGASASAMSWPLSVAALANRTASPGGDPHIRRRSRRHAGTNRHGVDRAGERRFRPPLLVSAAIGPIPDLIYLAVIRDEPITSTELAVGAGVHTTSPTF